MNDAQSAEDTSLATSYICAQTELVGTVQCAKGLRIAGVVRGDVHCSERGDVIIEPGGWVHGSIHTQGQILILGRVGTETECPDVVVHTPGIVRMANSARVFANVEYGELVLEGKQFWRGCVSPAGSHATKGAGPMEQSV